MISKLLVIGRLKKLVSSLSLCRQYWSYELGRICHARSDNLLSGISIWWYNALDKVFCSLMGLVVSRECDRGDPMQIDTSHLTYKAVSQETQVCSVELARH